MIWWKKPVIITARRPRQPKATARVIGWPLAQPRRNAVIKGQDINEKVVV
jgi:hypothetical protein